MLRSMFAAGLCAIVFFATVSRSVAQNSAEALLVEAEALYDGPGTSLETLAAVRAILDRIVAEHPASDLALSVLLSERIGEIDVAALNARLAEVQDPPRAPDDGAQDATEGITSSDVAAGSGQEQAPLPQPDVAEIATTPPTLVEAAAPPAGTEATEAALALKSQDIRDLQARLLALGFDPNGIDGVAGKGTRGALRDWQASVGGVPSGYLDAGQHAALIGQSAAALAAWRSDPANERLYSPPPPPPPIALGPGNIAGTWQFTSRCGRGSPLGATTITGAIALKHAGGNRYTGQVRNSQGLRGRFSGRVDGRNVTGETNWGLLAGRTQISGRVADSELVITGSDSLRCSLRAVKAR